MISSIETEVVAPYVEVRSPWLGLGAGTVIQVDGEKLVLTAGHVVQGYDSKEEETYKDEKGETRKRTTTKLRKPSLRRVHGATTYERQAEVVWYSAPEEEGGNDLALLRPTDSGGVQAAFGVIEKDDIRVGEDVWYIGTPSGIHSRLEKSIVAIRNYPMGDRAWTATNGCGSPGSSGGGLYVLRKGHYVLAGVVTRGYMGDKGMLCAKTPTDIHKFLDSYRKHKKEKS